jgi:hypothetical protein
MVGSMTVKYSMNWMGPVSLDWYRRRGWTQPEYHVQEKDNPYTGRKAGERYTLEIITNSYSCGRIDVMGTDDPHGEEIGVPPMLSLDWARFGRWLDTFETDAVWTLDQLIELYERTNPKICWDTYVEN